MLVKKLTFAAVAFCFAFTGIAARAQEAGALLDLLVRKRIISDQEAEEVRGELVKEYASTSAGKWKLSTPINEIELYGDARMRYEYRGGRTATNDPINPNDWYERRRERYRLRIGLRGTLLDDWFFGVRLETSPSNRSTNVTFGGDSSNGPFSKNDDGIFVGQAYIGYKGFPDITLTGGRMPNPLVTTPMLWDDDINPEGLAQQWKHTFNVDFGGGGGAVESYSKEGYSKEGKGVVTAPAAEPFKLKIDVFANFAQFVYDDNNPENPIGPARTTDANGFDQRVPTTDAYLLAWQVGARSLFRTTFTSSSRPPSTTTRAPATRLTLISKAIRPTTTKPGSTASSCLICRWNLAGHYGSCRCASSANSRSISRLTIALKRQAIQAAAVSATPIK